MERDPLKVQLIEEIEKRPAIWNTKSLCVKNELQELWYDLERVMRTPCDELKKSWENLYLTYVLELGNYSNGNSVSWCYFDLMDPFLRDHVMLQKEETSSIASSSTTGKVEAGVNNQSSAVHLTDYDMPDIRRNTVVLSEDSSNGLSDIIDDDDDLNLSFVTKQEPLDNGIGSIHASPIGLSNENAVTNGPEEMIFGNNLASSFVPPEEPLLNSSVVPCRNEIAVCTNSSSQKQDPRCSVTTGAASSSTVKTCPESCLEDDHRHFFFSLLNGMRNFTTVERCNFQKEVISIYAEAVARNLQQQKNE